MFTKRKNILLGWICVCFFLNVLTFEISLHAAVVAQSKSKWFRLELNGSLKNFFIVQTGLERFIPSSYPNELINSSWQNFRKEFETQGSDLTRFRLGLKMVFGENVSLHVAYEMRPMVQSNTQRLLSSLPLADSFFSGGLMGSSSSSVGNLTSFLDDRWIDFPQQLYQSTSFQLTHVLDRLYLSWSLERFDIILGRQSISFGVGRIFRPTDVLAPFSPQEIDKEARRGVDALTIEIPLGDLAELVIVGALQRLYPSKPREIGDENYFQDLAAGGAFRLKWSIQKIDFFVMGAYLQSDIIGGGGFSTSLWGMGLRAEAIYRRRLPAISNDRNPEGVFSLSAGLDYNLGAIIPKFQCIVGIEYFHNGAGTSDPKEYANVMQSYRFQRGESFQLGSDYLAITLQWNIHPLVSLTLWAMMNLHDVSGLIAPSLEYKIKTDISLFISSYLGLGAAPNATFVAPTENKPMGELQIQMPSELGASGMTFVLGFRAYF